MIKLQYLLLRHFSVREMKVAVLLLFCCQFAGLACQGSKKAQTTLDEKVSALQEGLMKKAVLRLSDKNFHLYARASPRNYSMIILLTSQHNKQCRVCGSVYEEFDIVANLYRASNILTKRMYFALADSEDASEVFKMLGIGEVPVLMHFPPRGHPQRGDKMDFSRMGSSAEAIAKWVHDRTGIQIRILRLTNYARPAALFLLLMLVGGLLYMKRNSIDYKVLWRALIIGFVISLLSGCMWNQIRNPPFMHRNPRTGSLVLISGSSQTQFLAESYLVMLLYVGITVGFLLLIYASDVPVNSSRDQMLKRLMVVAGLTLILVLFSCMLSLVRMKMPGYLYTFLFN
ncbi:Magnesium transporter protein 1 [Trichuris trichiura]|uniref:Magnesium transporter protein 1 n=1 Tax=Trichuris trichiura TaxID=36087 RepID=A0A077ZB51_TRITR|nr:Magnesium transporter protein 1 [Trichuris trichiura]